MFEDGAWNLSRSLKQEQSLMNWLNKLNVTELTIVECGAGKAIPTVRDFGQRLQARGAKLVRINMRDSDGPSGTISIALGARDALMQINQTMI